MALKFSQSIVVTDETMEDAFPHVVRDLADNLLKVARPDWNTVVISIEHSSLRADIWQVQLRCEGGRRNCQARGGR